MAGSRGPIKPPFSHSLAPESPLGTCTCTSCRQTLTPPSHRILYLPLDRIWAALIPSFSKSNYVSFTCRKSSPSPNSQYILHSRHLKCSVLSGINRFLPKSRKCSLAADTNFVIVVTFAVVVVVVVVRCT